MTDWIKTKQELVYDGWRKVMKKTYILPSGVSADFDVSLSNGGAAVLALTDDNEIICFKQFRPGPEKELYELPGGAIDPDEDPLPAANRELREETGYEAELEYIGSYYRDAYLEGRFHMFIGRHAKRVADQKLESTEDGELLLLSIDEFKEKLFEGEMTDTTLGYAGLLKLGLL